MRTPFAQEQKAAEEIARMAGAALHQRFRGEVTVEHKGAVDLVTDADRAAEALIVEAIQKRFPADHLLAEEGGGDDFSRGRCWVIDPLDGTTNFAHGFPWFCVSIALVVEAQPVVGVVYQPILNELFSAQHGQGARLNNGDIAVCSTEDLDHAFLATGFPYDRRTSDEDNLHSFHRAQKRVLACRRAGSAALDLAYVASGRFAGYWEMKLKPWDIAAGVLLVTEAGGRVSDFYGDKCDLSGRQVLATNGKIHSLMIDLLAED